MMVKKELGRNQTIRVNAWEHHEGGSWHIEAEYRTLLVEAQAIERDMMDALQEDLHIQMPPCGRLLSLPMPGLVGAYGNESIGGPIYRTDDGCCKRLVKSTGTTTVDSTASQVVDIIFRDPGLR